VKKQAFTLIELMVVVAIVAFLASIAVPKYFQYYKKARQAEVAMLLASLHTAQQLYWAEHGTYTTNLNGPGGLGWKPEGMFFYTYGFYFTGAQEGVNYFTGKLNTPARVLRESHASKQTFLAQAAGNTDEKNMFDIWSINEARDIRQR